MIIFQKYGSFQGLVQTLRYEIFCNFPKFESQDSYFSNGEEEKPPGSEIHQTDRKREDPLPYIEIPQKGRKGGVYVLPIRPNPLLLECAQYGILCLLSCFVKMEGVAQDVI